MPSYAELCWVMPAYAELCRVMLSYAELCRVMLSYAELCQLMPCVEDNSQCVNKMTAFILSFHIFWEDEKILFPSDFHSHSSRAIIKRDHRISQITTLIAFDILSAFVIIQKEIIVTHTREDSFGVINGCLDTTWRFLTQRWIVAIMIGRKDNERFIP